MACDVTLVNVQLYCAYLFAYPSRAYPSEQSLQQTGNRTTAPLNKSPVPINRPTISFFSYSRITNVRKRTKSADLEESRTIPLLKMLFKRTKTYQINRPRRKEDDTPYIGLYPLIFFPYSHQSRKLC